MAQADNDGNTALMRATTQGHLERCALAQGRLESVRAMLVRAAAPWSPGTHALFTAGAKARAVELLRIGWLLARRVQALAAESDATAQVEVAFRDVWLGHVMPLVIKRSTA